MTDAERAVWVLGGTPRLVPTMRRGRPLVAILEAILAAGGSPEVIVAGPAVKEALKIPALANALRERGYWEVGTTKVYVEGQ